ncbi:MAG: hypothetical protein OXN25_10325 [Candidatus Poribacteria bacterium]|nr:hypothetical protein [Candidatus Poribacteria bacterium]
MPTAGSANNGITDPAAADAGYAIQTAASGDFGATEGGFPDLNSLFEFGGTIELLLGAADSVTDAALKTAPANYRLAITEIMWGTNASNAATTAGDQWIEIYNAGDALLAADEVRLVFTSNVRLDRLGDELTDDDVAGLTADATYTVVDRVSVINRFGSR